MDGTWNLSFITAGFCLGLTLSARSAEKPNKGIGVIVVDVQEGKKPLDAIDIGGGRTQALWPLHCVQYTEGANILLNGSLFKAIARKKMNKDFDSYSGFENDGVTLRPSLSRRSLLLKGECIFANTHLLIMD